MMGVRPVGTKQRTHCGTAGVQDRERSPCFFLIPIAEAERGAVVVFRHRRQLCAFLFVTVWNPLHDTSVCKRIYNGLRHTQNALIVSSGIELSSKLLIFSSANRFQGLLLLRGLFFRKIFFLRCFFLSCFGCSHQNCEKNDSRSRSSVSFVSFLETD